MSRPDYSLQNLNDTALTVRESIITMLLEAKSGHSAGSLGMADVFTALYFVIIKHDPANPTWAERDRVMLSNGHICPVLYATLAEAGYFSKAELRTLRQIDSRLQGHPHLGTLPGVENTSGPLGQGLSQACGVAHALKMDNHDNRVYCLTSDAEHQEGQTWEAYQYAAKYMLDNLTVFVDRNNIQIEGETEDVMPLEPFKDKLQAFGWHVQEIDGNDMDSIIRSIHQAQQIQKKPSVIICNTIPGKGVEFMEGDFRWHGQPPNKDQAKEALKDLRTLKGEIWWE